MDIGAVLIGIALLVGVGAYVARPLFRDDANQSAERGTTGGSREQLTTHRNAIYALIRELDADYQTGKVGDQDYEGQRKRYVAEGVSILKQLDALQSQNSRAVLEAEIEAQVLALRSTTAHTQAMREQELARFCTQCGHPVNPEDRYCAQCGGALKGAGAE